MAVRLKDLGPRARAQVEAAMAEKPPRRPRSHAQARGRCRHRCHDCGHEADWPAIERHLDREHHRRSDIILEGGA